MYKVKKIIYIMLVIVMASILYLPLTVSSVAYAADDINFDESNALDDLKSSDMFNINNYPYIDGAKPSVINFSEYCYSPRAAMQSNFGLYIYVYNPGMLNISLNSNLNKIQIAVAYNDLGAASNYEKFSLIFCNKSTGDYNNIFYKFKVLDHKSSDGKTILQRQNSNERRYDVSGVELLTYGNPNATEYTVGCIYKFSGYAAGYGPDTSAESTLVCNVSELKTIELTVKHTNFRTGVSSLGPGHQNELNSVYFAVDNDVLEDYGRLQKIKAEWYEYKTSPIIVTDDNDIYSKILPYVGVNTSYNYDIHYYLLLDYIAQSPVYSASWGWNVPNNIICDATTLLSYLFYSNGVNISEYDVDKETLANYIYNYAVRNNGVLPIKDSRISADLFADEVDSGHTRGYNCLDIDAGDTFNMLSYDSTHSDWEKFWAKFWGATTNDDYLNKSPIHQITAADLISFNNSDVASNLMVNESDVNDLRVCYANAIKDNQTVFLFRYSVNDYYSQMLTVKENKLIDFDDNSSTYYAQETVFFDFDVIQLTFNKDGNYTVIPVVSNPIDIINAATSPLIKSLFDGFGDFWRLILLIIGLVILAIILLPILPYVIKLFIWLVMLPVRIIKAIGKAIKSGVKDKRRKY